MKTKETNMVDPDTGIDPVATDGEPDADELARRRAAKDEPKAGGSIADRTADLSDDPEEELFPLGKLEGDPKRSLKNLIRSNAKVEMEVSLMSAGVPLSGGLPDPEGFERLFVNAEVAKVEEVPLRKDGKVIGWKVRVHLRPTFVESAESALADPAAAAGG